jgi:hypothetical protein
MKISEIRVPNPLIQLLLPMVTKEQNQKVKILRDIVIFVGRMLIDAGASPTSSEPADLFLKAP